MALYAIADLHLSTLDSTNKSMEIFGRRWTDYMPRIENSWRALIGENDTVVIPGDISWALSLEEATSDLKFINSLPGRKILGKGNHDFWWSTMKKHHEHFEKNGISTIDFLFNNAHTVDDFVIAGTRGWFWDERNDTSLNTTDFLKLTKRETLRLETSLREAERLSEGWREILVFMHFPPVWQGNVSEELFALLKKYGIKRVFFGHIHGNYNIEPKFVYDGIEMNIISADFLSFVPKFISK